MIVASYSGTKTTYDLLGKPIASFRREAIVYKQGDKFIVAANLNGVRTYTDTFNDSDAVDRAARSHI